jgi:putative ABC transport system permease protein
MILFIKLIKESALFAATSIVANKLRTILTLLGITIGIFSIISVFSVVDALERQVRTSIESLGNNVVYIEKWPWQFGGDYQWWRYMNRPVVKLNELDELQRRTYTVESSAFMATTQRTVEYLNTSIDNVTMMGVSSGYDQVRTFDLEDGRFFSSAESSAGRSVAVLGADLASNLFPNTEPIGKEIKVFGRNILVIGVLKKEGSGGFGNSQDEFILIPVNYLNQFVDVSSERFSPNIMAKARPGISNVEMIDDITGVMRAVRRLKPYADDNFAINEASLITKGFDGLFAIIKLAGWIIGGFSILVGGFGIANIMFVSVRERTSIIGIQKAMGAKNYFILWQFLFEAVLLSLIGGAIGLLLVFTGTSIVASISEFDFTLTLANILLGLNVSAIIGLVSGFIPAWSASRLDPVEAIRSTG